jgi:hypothetical protein
MVELSSGYIRWGVFEIIPNEERSNHINYHNKTKDTF